MLNCCDKEEDGYFTDTVKHYINSNCDVCRAYHGMGLKRPSHRETLNVEPFYNHNAADFKTISNDFLS
jgi:hypothetical protein